ncbi:CBS domain-containing protein [Foetidibacter luteolus]|uniref:CBS domain-containing protein n=1 Tax=Foetidibacter luteolus TaxID=2608880 RepID=UPI00129AC68F|nr:CBS domain-containing protein [Foetidibacter luteolus]
MLALKLIQSTYPSIDIEDSAGFAIQLMEDYDVQHLPVVSDEKYIGLVSKDDLLDMSDKASVSANHTNFAKVSVAAKEHFFRALQLCSENSLSVMPVINEQQQLEGLLTQHDLLKATALYNSVDEIGGLIVLEMEKRSYAFGEINRLVETNDAHITQLNSYTDPDTGLFTVSIKVNKYEISDIVATFQRYDYSIKYYFGEEQYENELKENYNLLMNYINM